MLQENALLARGEVLQKDMIARSAKIEVLLEKWLNRLLKYHSE